MQAFGRTGIWSTPGQTCPLLPPVWGPLHSFSLAGQVWFPSRSGGEDPRDLRSARKNGRGQRGPWTTRGTDVELVKTSLGSSSNIYGWTPASELPGLAGGGASGSLGMGGAQSPSTGRSGELSPEQMFSEASGTFNRLTSKHTQHTPVPTVCLVWSWAPRA